MIGKMTAYDLKIKKIVTQESLDRDDSEKKIQRVTLQKKDGDFKIQLTVQGTITDIEDFFSGMTLALESIITATFKQKQRRMEDFGKTEGEVVAEHL